MVELEASLNLYAALKEGRIKNLTLHISDDLFLAVIKHAVEEEREACAKICNTFLIGEYPPNSGKDDRYDLARIDMATKIRNRSLVAK